MAAESSPVPSLEALRALARAQGVEPSDDDLVAAARFLATILPELREIEDAVPPGTAPVGALDPEDGQA
jgi:hypothetical protein